MNKDGITVRPIDFERDVAPLKTFIDERDAMRLDHAQQAVRDGDCFIYVVDDDGTAAGWAMVHINFRDDQDWDPPDADTMRFQQGENAYLENIALTPRLRSHGVGPRLLRAVEEEAKRRGKRYLWLHTSENNQLAHRVFDRDGWVHETSLTPEWKPGQRMRIYKKAL
jgi:ribosomal protein S18 acetylase RimI-like enzyme